MSKILRIILIVLFAISALLLLIYYAGGKDTITLGTNQKVETYPRFTDIFILWAYILTGIAVGLTFVLSILQMITNPQKAKKGLLGILGLVVVLAIAYVMASGEVLGIKNPELVKYDVPSTLKYAGTLIKSIYILTALTVLSMVYTGVAKMFK